MLTRHILFFLWRCGPTRAMVSTFLRFLDHTQRRSTVGRTPLDAWSARRRDLYLTTHNTRNRHPCPRWDLNPHSQQASGRRPATRHISLPKYSNCIKECEAVHSCRQETMFSRNLLPRRSHCITHLWWYLKSEIGQAWHGLTNLWLWSIAIFNTYKLSN